MINYPAPVNGDVLAGVFAPQGGMHRPESLDFTQHILAPRRNGKCAHRAGHDIGYHGVNRPLRLPGDGCDAAVDVVGKVNNDLGCHSRLS